MKKIFKLTRIFVTICILLVACVPNGLNAKATEIAKKFYTDYLKEEKTTNISGMKNVMKKYMTETMCEELELRTNEMEADAVTGVQDATGFIEKMEVAEGVDEDWVKVIFDMKTDENTEYNIYEIDLHFKDEKNKRMIDTLNLTIYDVDKDGDKTKREYITKYANKEELTESDRQEMERIKKYYEELNEAGFIG